ncbi:hypothetical protein PSACC_03307 [Paramicrosporidium saccamoebae]|uniref:ATPase AAA-type core domain-containing protein n=1 Tax=Paramicrosporidium saccamoebae TaxID=1246581 RepID=A0A2H9TGH9_9FUNG|nr:hypothetical protein PSACC_03307 [Paramicrosporidium saccamoebae]
MWPTIRFRDWWDRKEIIKSIARIRQENLEHRVASVLRKCLDDTKVLVFGVTSRPDIIDTSITRSGRLCNNVHVSVSTSEQRFLLLHDIVVDGILSRNEMLQLSNMTHGYSAADFEKLYALATRTAIRRQEPSASASASIMITLSDFESSLLQMRPSIIADLPTVPYIHSMPRLIGVDAIRTEILAQFDTTAWSFVAWTQREWKNFACFKDSPRQWTLLLTELDGLHTKKQGDGVFILTATSHIDAIDPAILRPGRIGVHVEMPVFGDTQRLEFIRERMRVMPIDLCDEQIKWIVDNTAGLMVSELDGIFREAALSTLRNNLEAAKIEFDSIKSFIVA